MSGINVLQPVGLVMERSRSWPQSIREFEALVDTYQHRLVQFAFCRLQSLADAEDVVQDVLVQAYREREKRKDVGNVAAFLYRMVANRSTDVARRRKHAAAPLEGVEIAAPEGVAAESATQQRRIEGLLGRLPARQAEVIRLRVYGELPFEAIAQAAGCTVPTVKSRFRYGIQKLRRILKRSGGER
ncbi:MAG: RNA polymerase sigma factor [Acidobacteria bacterium]|nr:RNA polymerase sigma factor [Acidobacteriota bacterium]